MKAQANCVLLRSPFVPVRPETRCQHLHLQLSLCVYDEDLGCHELVLDLFA